VIGSGPTRSCRPGTYREGRNPFTGEVIRYDMPGYALWEQSPEKTVPIEYRAGRLTLRATDARGRETMKRIARALDARLFDAHGREIAVQ
jgi:hypothetical protein